MIIHVVRPGDSIYSIASLYGVTPASIISENELAAPDRLVVGQTIVITEGIRSHTVAPGQSLYSIAALYGVTVNAILAINPQLTDPALVYPGQVISIPPSTQKLGTLEVNGYAYPNTDLEVLAKTFPYLTYLSIFSYDVNSDGSLEEINDTPLIQAARNANVAPLMVITNREFSSDVASSVLNSPEIQERLLDNVVEVLESKNYYGLDIDFEYLYPRDRENYNAFLQRTVDRLRPLGYTISTAVAPKLSADQPGLLYEAHDYPVHGRLMDHVVIMTYEWGYLYGPPMAVAPLPEVRRVIQYAVTEIPRNKILMGIPNYGYDWTLPFVRGTAARILSNTGAVNLAYSRNAAIQYDTTAQSPYFNYFENGRQHVVWFEDARSIRAKLLLANEFGLGGVSYWTVGQFFPQNWLVLNSLFDVIKVI